MCSRGPTPRRASMCGQGRTYGIPVNLERPDAAQPPTTGYGPEQWRIFADMDWSYSNSAWYAWPIIAETGAR
jgi:hypothetical protein